MKNLKQRSGCPISCSLDVWGDKWTLLIIRDLMNENGRTYGDFLKSAEGIATNILAARLQALEENQLIVKLIHPDHPNALPINLGLGHLWRLAIDYPESKVRPCVHRAPKEKTNRLLLIC